MTLFSPTIPAATFYFYKDQKGLNQVDKNVLPVDVFQTHPPVIAPDFWSGTSVRVVVDKYLLPCDDNNIFNMVRRVVNRIAHFENPVDAQEFEADLFEIVINQKATWNSPVWFNVGNPSQMAKNDEQAWACLILGVDDYMEDRDGNESIIGGWTVEAKTFMRGSGSGVNISRMRARNESLSGGTGVSSGPISLWMRPTDAVAENVSSGGRTRRAAKMVIMDVDHPDILEFVRLKSKENKRAKDLRSLGYDVGMNGTDSQDLVFQNANNSVRVTDAFMKAVGNGSDWNLKARHDGWEKPFPGGAKALWKEMCDAAADSADPGIQFHDTTNYWNTCINDGEITSSNPCSEYLWLNNTVCNLSSINVGKFIDVDKRTFDVHEFSRVTRLMIRSMDVLCDITSHVTPYIKEQALNYRTLGLGFSNIGASLMSLGIPYDSQEGRDFAGAVSSLMQAVAYDESAQLASLLGSYPRYEFNADPHNRVLAYHSLSSALIPPKEGIISMIISTANDQWTRTKLNAQEYGLRNAQVSVIAPTGTISFMMGCETSGIEPLFALAVKKELIGNGGTIDMAAEECVSLGQYAVFGDNVPEDWQMHPVFATAAGINSLKPEAHVDMVCAIQPFISGGISKTINLPAGSTSEDVSRAYARGWKQGAKALAVYIDGSKHTQPLTTTDTSKSTPAVVSGNIDGRRKMPGTREGVTHKFIVGGDHVFYLTANFYPDTNKLGEIFLSGGKEGTAFAGMLDQWCIAVSMALQSGNTFEDLRDKFEYQRFDPNGVVFSDSPIKFCSSVPDYVFKWLGWYMETRSPKSTQPPLTFQEYFETLPQDVVVEGVGMECPRCSAMELRQQGKCKICKNCFYADDCG